MDCGIVNENENEMDCFVVGGYAGGDHLYKGGHR